MFIKRKVNDSIFSRETIIPIIMRSSKKGRIWICWNEATNKNETGGKRKKLYIWFMEDLILFSGSGTG